MAIIRCKECQNEISDQAKVCPNCGAPTETFKQIKENNHKAFSIIVGVILIVTIIVFFIYKILTNQPSYIYGKQAINILKDYKERKLTEKETKDQSEQLYDEVEKAREDENASDSESSRLLGVSIGILGTTIEMSYDGLSQAEIDEEIEYFKDQISIFSY